MRTRTVLGIVAIGAAVAAGCSSDPDADPTTTTASTDEATTSPPPETTGPALTTERATTSSTTSSTTLPPTTTGPEQVKAEAAAAYLELEAKLFEMLVNPALEGLEARAAEFAVPGSLAYQAVVERVTTLVGNDQHVAANEPDLRSVTVEAVALIGEPPTAADVTVCQVTNSVLIKNAATSPVPGSSIVVSGTGDLAAFRFTQSLRLTDGGWRHEGGADPNDPFWPGLAECPAS